jgi:hypothetical protein
LNAYSDGTFGPALNAMEPAEEWILPDLKERNIFRTIWEICCRIDRTIDWFFYSDAPWLRPADPPKPKVAYMCLPSVNGCPRIGIVRKIDNA